MLSTPTLERPLTELQLFQAARRHWRLWRPALGGLGLLGFACAGRALRPGWALRRRTA